MEIFREILHYLQANPLLKNKTGMFDQIWDLIATFFPLLIIIFFWLVSRRNKAPRQEMPVEKERQAVPTLSEILGIGNIPDQTGAGGPGNVENVRGREDSRRTSWENVLQSQRDQKIPGGPVITSKPLKPRWWG